MPGNGRRFCTRGPAEDLGDDDIRDQADVVVVHEDEADGAVFHEEGEAGACGVVAAGHGDEVEPVLSGQIRLDGRGTSRCRKSLPHLGVGVPVVLHSGLECPKTCPSGKPHGRAGFVAVRLNIGHKESIKTVIGTIFTLLNDLCP